MLAVNLATGVLVARSIGPGGRGDLAVLATLTQFTGWIAALGTNEGVAFLASKREEDIPRIVGTALAFLAGLGLVGVVLAELALPLVLHAQHQSVIDTGRWFVLSVVLVLATSQLQSLLGGSHDFAGMNVLRVLQPTGYLVGLVVLALTVRLTVDEVLLASIASSVLALGVVGARFLRRVGVARPSREVARAALAFGIKVQGSLFGGLVNGRLDLLMMPAFLSVATVGLYSVATNTAGILFALVGVLGQVVFPAAARRGGAEGMRLVVRAGRITVGTAGAVALVLGVLAPWLLPLVYGDAFRGSAVPLQIMLPGVVLAATSQVLDAGLQATGRPGAASICQLWGLVVTVVGLSVSLEPFGMDGAATVTTLSYLTCFVAALVYLRREPGFSVRALFSPRRFVADGLDVSRTLLRRRGTAPGPELSKVA
nr:polysaccharide biosynthesis C-terminal domain-containing protein [Motilibacter rhizosphaerae]